MNIAQRWEKPSTAQEERRAILRARRLCDDNPEHPRSENLEVSKTSPILIPFEHQGLEQLCRRFRKSNTFLAVLWMLGVRQSLVETMFQTIPDCLISAIFHLEDVLTQLPQSTYQTQLAASRSIPDSHATSETSFLCRWDPDTMERTRLEASPEFCNTIAGTTAEVFVSKAESDGLMLPCSSIQYLCYFIDGALSIAEGLTSWTRSNHCFRPRESARDLTVYRDNDIYIILMQFITILHYF